MDIHLAIDFTSVRCQMKWGHVPLFFVDGLSGKEGDLMALLLLWRN